MLSHGKALLTGHLLRQYKTIDVLGFGSFGVTYLAYDPDHDEEVAIKEYLPSDIVDRQSDSTLTARSKSLQKDFEWGLSRFLDEARALAKFQHNHIVRVKQFFKQNSTGYMVMDYEKGETLDLVLNRVASLDEINTKEILLPILNGLKLVHEQGFLHRDINPSNIIIRERDGSPVLVGFGAAGQVFGPQARAMTAALTAGYAPLEQYSPEDNQGPWTDIYALGAVAYKCVTGERPPDATVRVERDTLIPISVAVGSKVSEGFAKAIEWALHVEEVDRPQSVDELIAAISSEPKDEVQLFSSLKGTRQKGGRTEDKIASHLGNKDAGGGPSNRNLDDALDNSDADTTVGETLRGGEANNADTIVDFGGAWTKSAANAETVIGLCNAQTSDEVNSAETVIDLGHAQTVSDAKPSDSRRRRLIRPDESGHSGPAARVVRSIVEPKSHAIPRPNTPARRKLVYLAAGVASLLMAALLIVAIGTQTSKQKPIDRNDQQAWERADRESIISAFETYLQSYPQGSHVRQAQNRIKNIRTDIDAAWKTAQASDTPLAYDEFLEKYGKNNIFVTEAANARERALREESEWQRAQDQLTISAYQQYLYSSPTGKHRSEAEQRLSELRIKTQKQDDLEGVNAVSAPVFGPCQAYLINYPDGRHAKDCEQHVNDLRQLTAQISAYQQRLMDLGLYPGPANGIMTNETTAAIGSFQAKSGLPQTVSFDATTMVAIDKALAESESLYRQARDRHTSGDYQAFLAKFPNGRYSQDVRDRMSQCRTQTRPGEPKVSTITREVRERNGNQQRACAAAKTNVEDQAQKACAAGGGHAEGPVVGQTKLDTDNTLLDRIFSGYICIGRVELQCQTPGTVVSGEVCP